MATHSVLDLSTLVLVSCTSGLPEQCASYLTEGFTFVGPFGKGTAAGIHAFMGYFAKTAPLITMLGLSYSTPILVFQSGDVSVVFIGSGPGEKRFSVYPRATFVWCTSLPERPQLVHMHFSIPTIEKTSSTVVNAGTDIASTGASSCDQAPLIAIRDTDGVSHAVDPRAIVYLRAAHQYVDVHLLWETIRTRSSLAAMLDRLPHTFVRVHRSFAINAKLVTTMTSSKITMSNGDHILIPVKRRTIVRQQIREAMALSPARPHPGE